MSGPTLSDRKGFNMGPKTRSAAFMATHVLSDTPSRNQTVEHLGHRPSMISPIVVIK
ncbi:MAG: hypothetical protein WBX25_12060 [Rhodomicrobium sp.]